MAVGRLEKYPTAGEYQDKLSDTGWQSLTNPTEYTGTIYYRAWGNVVTVQAFQINLATAFTANSYRTIHTNGLASVSPSVHIIVDCGNVSQRGLIGITTSGQIDFYRRAQSWSTSDNISFTVTYLKA